MLFFSHLSSLSVSLSDSKIELREGERDSEREGERSEVEGKSVDCVSNHRGRLMFILLFIHINQFPSGTRFTLHEDIKWLLELCMTRTSTFT